jgi:TolB-like protein/tetratricopeptide (TPR) repeat protein
MDAEHWARVKELYTAALDSEGVQREAYLDGISKDDPELGELLRSLLAEAPDDPGFLDEPSVLIAAVVLGGSSPVRVFSSGDVIAERFTIARYIAGGGMGEVYEAFDAQLGERVALKTIRPEIASDRGVIEQFKKEVRRSRMIASRHVCRVHDFFTHRKPDGSEIVFFSMKLLEGETLAARLRIVGTLAIEESLSVAREIAEGLRAAHHERIVHGDLKAGNVLLTNGGAVITDFGLSRRVLGDGSPESTIDPFHGGTPAYMAPEQVEGKPASQSSDIYSFGLVLYEMVTGRLPFEDPNAQAVAVMRLRQNPVSPRSLVPDLPRNWETTILRCIERDPAKRFGTAEEVVRALEGVAPLTNWRAARWQRAAVSIIALPVAAVLAAGGYALWNGRSHAAPNSIAVLPFENLRGSSDTEYFGDAFTDEVTNELTRATQLRVMGRDSSARFKQSALAPVDVGRRLGVQYVLTGSVQRTGGQLRLIARLVNVGNGFQVWSHDYARDERDFFLVRNQIATEVGASLHVSVATMQAPQLTPASLDVRDLYWMGRFYWNQRNERALLASIGYFQKAIEKDPRFALGYSGLADTYCVLAESGTIPPAQALADAKQAALTAVSLDHDLADGYVSLGQVASLYDRDFTQAEHYFRRALELSPKLVSAHQWYSYMLVKQRRFAEALNEARLALDAEPLSLPANINLAVQYWYAGDENRTVQQCRKLTQLDERLYFNHLVIAQIFGRKGLVGEALAEMDQVRPDAKDDPLTVRFWAELDAVLGRRTEAEERIKQLLAMRSRVSIPPSFIAAAYASVGDRDHAFEWLEQAYVEHDGFVSMMGVYPAFDPIRTDVRYRPMLARLGLTAQTGRDSTQTP